MARVVISSKTIEEAMRLRATREALEKKAKKVQSRAEQIAASEQVQLDSTVTSGTRPKGRPYSRVESPNTSQEWGSHDVGRRRILGRAAESA